MALPSSHPERKEKLPFPKSPPPNGKRASNITLRDLEYLTDILFFSLGLFIQCTCLSVPGPIRAGGKEMEKDDRAERMRVYSSLSSHYLVGHSCVSFP